MNCEDWLNQAAEAIVRAKPESGQTYQIIFSKGEILCSPIRSRVQPEVVFLRIAGSTLQHGLTVEQWNSLSERIAKFVLMKGLI